MSPYSHPRVMVHKIVQARRQCFINQACWSYLWSVSLCCFSGARYRPSAQHRRMQSLSFGVNQWSEEAREDMREWTEEGVSRWALNANHQNRSETSFNGGMQQIKEAYDSVKSPVDNCVSYHQPLGILVEIWLLSILEDQTRVEVWTDWMHASVPFPNPRDRERERPNLRMGAVDARVT